MARPNRMDFKARWPMRRSIQRQSGQKRKKTAEAVFFRNCESRLLRNRSMSLDYQNSYWPLHEPGRYFSGIGLVAAGPHFQTEIVLPPSVVEASAVAPVASMNGDKEMEFNALDVLPPMFVAFPSTVIAPVVPLTEPDVTYFDAGNVHGGVVVLPSVPLISVTTAVLTISETVTRHALAASMTSVTLARTV